MKFMIQKNVANVDFEVIKPHNSDINNRKKTRRRDELLLRVVR